MINICNAIDHCENNPECDYIKFRLFYHRGKMKLWLKTEDMLLKIYQKG